MIDGSIVVEALASLTQHRWMRHGACLDSDVDFFSDGIKSTRAAKAVCAGCVVQSQCFDYAAENEIGFGIWGGTAPRERR